MNDSTKLVKVLLLSLMLSLLCAAAIVGLALPLLASGDGGNGTNLSLQISHVTSSNALLILHHPVYAQTGEVYEVWSKTNLAIPGWMIETDVWAVVNQNWTPFTVPTLGRMSLFIWARDWTGIDENSNGVPDWWEYEHPGVLPPVITAQPTNQTVMAGGTARFSVAVSSTCPLTYRWQLNGTNLPNNIITTVAGGGQNYPGNGGAATNASLSYPSGVAVDASGNLFIADSDNDVIRKVDANGIISTVAGNGNWGYSGDGGAATNASLYYPSGVAVDASGDLFIADTYNSVIRKVDTNGIISTVAGNGNWGYSGDGGAATNASLSLDWPSGVAVDASGNLFIADSDNDRIREVNTNGIISTVAGNGNWGYSGDGGAATNASLRYPSGVAVDASGNLFIADYYNSVIRKVSTNGIISTMAGNGSGGYSGDGGAATNASLRYPSGVALDASGNLFIADSYNDRIREVNTNGIIITVAGNGNWGYSGDGGAATNASLSLYEPSGVAVDASGDLFIADSGNSRIREVMLFASSLTLYDVTLNNAGNYTVILTSPCGSVTSIVATLTVLAPPSITGQPQSATVIRGANVTFTVGAVGTAPLSYQWLQKGLPLIDDGVHVTGATTTSLRLNGVLDSDATYYQAVVTNLYGQASSSNATLTVLDPPVITTQPQSQTVNAEQNVTFNVIAGGFAPLSYQWYFNGTNILSRATNASLTLTNVQVTQAGNYAVLVSNAAGSVTSIVATLTVLGPPTIVSQPQCLIVITGTPAAFSVQSSGTTPLYFQWQKNGMNLTDVGNISGSTTPNLLLSSTITNDAGNYSVIITNAWGSVSSSVAGLTVVLTPELEPTNQTVVAGGTATFSAVVSSTCPLTYQWQLNGTNLPNNIITTVAGGGQNYPGNGGAATNASLDWPSGVALDASGDLFIADTYNSVIREVSTNGIITTVAGNGDWNYYGDGGAATNASLYCPAGVAVDASGNLFIADTDNSVIRKVDTNGIISTVAGGGQNYPGNGGAATNASLYYPSGVAVDASGILFIADTDTTDQSNSMCG
jgi:hypothetical protein